MGTSPEEDDDHHEQPKQPHLATQDASSVDPTKLTALTPEVVRIEIEDRLACDVAVFVFSKLT